MTPLPDFLQGSITDKYRDVIQREPIIRLSAAEPKPNTGGGQRCSDPLCPEVDELNATAGTTNPDFMTVGGRCCSDPECPEEDDEFATAGTTNPDDVITAGGRCCSDPECRDIDVKPFMPATPGWSFPPPQLNA